VLSDYGRPKNPSWWARTKQTNRVYNHAPDLRQASPYQDNMVPSLNIQRSFRAAINNGTTWPRIFSHVGRTSDRGADALTAWASRRRSAVQINCRPAARAPPSRALNRMRLTVYQLTLDAILASAPAISAGKHALFTWLPLPPG